MVTPYTSCPSTNAQAPYPANARPMVVAPEPKVASVLASAMRSNFMLRLSKVSGTSAAPTKNSLVADARISGTSASLSQMAARYGAANQTAATSTTATANEYQNESD